jgi:putative effector of murein hydrolase
VRLPSPIVAAVVLLFLSLLNLGNIGKYSGSEQAGYLIGIIVFPAVLALAYTWWYQRRRAR